MNKSNIVISKVKLTNFNPGEDAENQMCGVELGFSEEIRNTDGGLEFVKEHPTVKLRHFIAHPSLYVLFDDLRPHLAMICEYFKTTGQEYDEIIQNNELQAQADNIYVTQVVLTGDNENSGVVLSGFKVLKNGMKIVLATPNITFEGFGYDYAMSLSDSCDLLMSEALRCLTERRRKVIQTQMFEDDDDAGFGAIGESVQDAFTKKSITVKMSANG